MPDREKVLKALEHHKETAVCNGCPYAGDDDTAEGNCPVYDDALAILREQEEEINKLRWSRREPRTATEAWYAYRELRDGGKWDA